MSEWMVICPSINFSVPLKLLVWLFLTSVTKSQLLCLSLANLYWLSGTRVNALEFGKRWIEVLCGSSMIFLKQRLVLCGLDKKADTWASLLRHLSVFSSVCMLHFYVLASDTHISRLFLEAISMPQCKIFTTKKKTLFFDMHAMFEYFF